MNAIVARQHGHLLRMNILAFKQGVRPIAGILNGIAAEMQLAAAMHIHAVRPAIMLLAHFVIAIAAINHRPRLPNNGDILRVNGANQPVVPAAGGATKKFVVCIIRGAGPGLLAKILLRNRLDRVIQKGQVILRIAGAFQASAAAKQKGNIAAKTNAASDINAGGNLHRAATPGKAIINRVLNGPGGQAAIRFRPEGRNTDRFRSIHPLAFSAESQNR